MIWLTWGQFRAAATMLFAALAALAALLAVTGPGLADDYATGIAACTTQGGDCSDFVDRFFGDHLTLFLAVSAVVLVLPALIGLFWGAPLLTRELGVGTHRPGCHDRRGAGQPGGGLVVQPHRQDRPELPEDGTPVVRHPRHRPHRLRGLRRRPGRDRRDAGPPHPGGHGHHPGRLRRRPDRHAAAGAAPPGPTDPFDHPGHRIKPGGLFN